MATSVITCLPFLSAASVRSWSSASRSVIANRPRIYEIRSKRVALFDRELKRQQALITRIEKIQVSYEGQPENATIIMNKNISTPFNCAQHLAESLVKHSLVAEVNGELWDLHRPLETDCTLRLLHCKAEEAHQAALVNKTFWRSCSFLLGAIIEDSFKDSVSVTLHSFPSANVRSGSFVHDVKLDLLDWQPTQNDLRMLAATMIKFSQANHQIHRLEVKEALALKMFEDNPYKSEQIPDIALKSVNKDMVTLYRVGDHVDISRGPMISSSGHIGRCSITAVHKLNGLYRFQGVALPSELFLNHFGFGIIEARARKLNPARLPELRT